MKDVTDNLFEDQGKTTQDAKGITPPRATKARDITPRYLLIETQSSVHTITSCIMDPESTHPDLNG